MLYFFLTVGAGEEIKVFHENDTRLEDEERVAEWSEKVEENIVDHNLPENLVVPLNIKRSFHFLVGLRLELLHRLGFAISLG